MIVFRNKGLIDTKFITTFGVSAKEGANPVGFFGTGLKYAIAVCVREGIHVEIDIGGKTHWFTKVEGKLRNKEFSFIQMHWDDDHGEETFPLPFTTELGKKWLLWQAFRELYCNCTDENGDISHVSSPLMSADFPRAQEDETVIRVSGEAFEQCWRDKGNYILDVEPFYEHFMASVSEGHNKAIFLRGIRAQELKKHTMYTYNVLFQAELTEDRTIKYEHESRHAIAAAVSQSEDEEMIKKVLLAPEGWYERDLDFSSAGSTCKVFLDLVGKLRKKHFCQINQSAIKAYERQRQSMLNESDAVQLTQLEQIMLARATGFVRNDLRCTHIDDYPVVVVEMDENILGTVRGDKIFLNKRCFRMGTKMVASTLYEEYLHAHLGLSDCCRDMQNYLMDTIASLAEEARGEPL